MKRLGRLISVFMIFAMIMVMMPTSSFAAVKKPGKVKISKVAVVKTNVAKPKITVKYNKVKNAKSYKLYRVTSKQVWKYWKTVKASQKKKYSNKKKYKLVKKGKKLRVYQSKKKTVYKQLATSKKTSMTYTGSWNTTYKLVVRAYNGKKAGAYSAAKTVKTGKKPSIKPKTTEIVPECDTYVFFGSDSRATDESWKSVNGNRIISDTSGTEGTPRSDVIMLIIVNKTDKSINLVSVYRDTALNKDVEDGDSINFQKANKAYADYGPKQACKVIEKNLDIKIKGYAAANFKGVANVIDDLIELSKQDGLEISGLTEKVPENGDYWEKGHRDAIDTVNACIDEMNVKYDTYTEPLTDHSKDTQKLNGFQAIAFARVRSTTGWEMMRTARQRMVLKQMIEQYRKLSDAEKIALIVQNATGIETDLGLNELASLARDVAGYKIADNGYPYYKGQGIKYSDEENKGDKATLIVPCDISKNVTKLHTDVYGNKKYTINSTINSYNQALENEMNAYSDFTGYIGSWDKY